MHGPEGPAVNRKRPDGQLPRLAQALGQVHDFQASPQRPGQPRMGGDQRQRVGGPAGLEMRQVDSSASASSSSSVVAPVSPLRGRGPGSLIIHFSSSNRLKRRIGGI